MAINSFLPLFSSLAQENKLKILHTGNILNFFLVKLKPFKYKRIRINMFFTCFRLELNGHRRRLTWEATPRSIHEGVSSAIMNSDCLVFDTTIAQLFADNGNLGINVTISMCWLMWTSWRRRTLYQVCLRHRWNDIRTTYKISHPIKEKGWKHTHHFQISDLVQRIFIKIKIITDGERQYFVSSIV